ncbi:unnamed protein product, partial [Mesorhabditis belari]|uniref:Uncharacterized protein n=1 Tax=Mesorhabditis belari TaxID=2138241 RepID=A0AAF3FNL4_9BILA
MSRFLPAQRAQDAKPSIWVEFTTLAAETKAVNLGQGFPDFAMPTFVAKILEEITKHPERVDWHQYTRGYGHLRLVNILSKLYGDHFLREIDPQSEILVTIGAYLALYYTFIGWIDEGDEVLIIEPAYDCYSPQVTMAGGKPISIAMSLPKDATSAGQYKLDLQKLYDSCTSKTKMLVLNNPNNPTGKLFSKDELEGIAKFVQEKDLIVVADEVYEWHVYGGNEMIRFASLPGMYDRTITIGSAGKAFSVTGWKLGWAIGPKHLLEPLKTIHQNCVFTCPTPIQEAVAQAFEKEFELLKTQPEKSYLKTGLSSELIAKRDRLSKALTSAGFRPILPQAGYFMMADYTSLDGPYKNIPTNHPDPIDFHFVRWLCKEKKLATIPPSAFYSPEHKHENANLIRTCFFKKDETLDAAEKILKGDCRGNENWRESKENEEKRTMFQLAPITLKPEVRAQKAQHPDFEKLLVALIRNVAQEKEVVQIDLNNAKKLLNKLDAFMAYGLYASNKCYWPFVREFLPKTEAQLLKVEWQCTSDRALSMAWLKDALNRGSFHFQLLGFKQNKKLICRFYHPNAFFRNYGMLERVVDECERLSNVMFAFPSPSAANQVFVPAAIVVETTPVQTSRIIRKTKKRREREQSESEASIPAVTVPLTRNPLPTVMDQEYVLNDLLARQRQRTKLNGFVADEPKSGDSPRLLHKSEDIDEPHEQPLEILIRKNMSGVFGSFADQACGSYDSLFVDDPPRKNTEVSDTHPPVEDTKCEGEINLQSGEVLKLAMDVFRDQRENLQRCFQVFERFVVGRPAERLLILTDQNIYILSQSLTTDNQDTSQVQEMTSSSQVEYHSHCEAAMDAIDYIGLTDDFQSVLLFAKQGTNFKMHDEEHLSGDVVMMATGDKKLGKIIADAMCMAAEKGGRQGGAPLVYTDSTPYALIVRRFLDKELKQSEEILHTSLVFWRETSTLGTAVEISHQGYLMHRSLDVSWWRKPNDDWKQSYFLLQGRKLYVFTDMTCKIGERVINLSGGAVETQEVELKKHHTFVLQITFPDRPDEAPIQLQCTSRDEMTRWMHLLSIALSSQDDGEDAVSCALIITASSLVICQEGENVLRDDFMRSLLVLNLTDLLSGVRMATEHHTCLILESNEMREWFFFRSENELSRICKSLEKFVKIQNIENNVEENTRQLLLNQARRVPDLWHRTVFGTEHLEMLEEL